MKNCFAVLCLIICSAFRLAAQDWSQFNQKVDVTAYRGGEFRLSAFVRVEGSNPKICQARLWARVDKKKGIGFFDNMDKRPITLAIWKEYTIEGSIDAQADKLIIGGLFFGFGKYYFDKFSLQIKMKGGDWQSIQIQNPDFEENPLQGWFFQKNTGFEISLATANSLEGKQSLQVDGNGKLMAGKFIRLNGLDFYYEFHGQGDTLLMLHGNSQSIQAFSKQIPELEKHFTVLAMDSRAQGYSGDDGSPVTYDLMAEDVNALLDQLKIKKVNLLGWSDGGNTGLILAMKHPDKVKRLAVMGANLFCNSTSIEGRVIQSLEKQKAGLEKQQTPADDVRLRMIIMLLTEPNIHPDDLAKITCPTLVMAGAKDLIKEEHTRLIAGKIKNSKLVIFEKGTHFEPQQNPARFNKAVLEFFKEK